MTTFRYPLLPLLFGIAAWALAAAANATRIDGLNILEPVIIEDVVPVVDDETMQVTSPDGRKLSVTPWPEFFPRRFGKQTVTATRQAHPAGPVDRLSFKRASEESPWLMLGNGARRSAAIVEKWQLQRSGRRWIVNNGRSKKSLQTRDFEARPVMVDVGSDRWCIYLLDSAIPAEQPNIATEAEAQIGWAAVRLSPLQRKCTAQK